MKRFTLVATAVVGLSIGVAACSDQPTQPVAAPAEITISDADLALAHAMPQQNPVQACLTFVSLVAGYGRITSQEAAVLRAACETFAGATTRPTVGQVCAYLLGTSGLPVGNLRTRVERVCALLTRPRPRWDD